jgi:protein-disulfide isomerase
LNDQWRTAALAGLLGAVIATGAVLGAARLGFLSAPSEKQFHAYLMAHPEVLIEMQTKLQADSDADDTHQVQVAIDKLGLSHLLDPKIAYVTGPASAKKTVVEFFDYNCVHCRRTFPVIQKFYEAHKGDTRFAFVELPIFGQASDNAARSALAARLQPGKYVAFHFALMGEPGEIGPGETVDAAKKAGLDVGQLMADLKDPTIAQQMAEAHALAERVKLTGTPLFIVNGKAHPGEITKDELEQLWKS